MLLPPVYDLACPPLGSVLLRRAKDVTWTKGLSIITTGGVYQCRLSRPDAPATLFHSLVEQGLEQTDAETLGKTLG